MSECLLKLCAHRALDGAKCHAPARRDSDYCRHHAPFHRPPVIFPAYIYKARTIRDFQLAIYRTTQDMLAGTITNRYCGQILYEISKGMRQVGHATDALSEAGH